MKIDLLHVGGYTLVVVAGALDESTVDDFDPIIDEALTLQSHVQFDLTAVSRIDLAGLRALVFAAQRLRGARSTVSVIGTSAAVACMFASRGGIDLDLAPQPDWLDRP